MNEISKRSLDLHYELHGKIEVISRPSWGHHPHGLDNPLGKIVRFILQHTLNKD